MTETHISDVRPAVTITALGCPLEDCKSTVPMVGDVKAAMHAHVAEAHRNLIDQGHGGPLALLIGEHVSAALALQARPAHQPRERSVACQHCHRGTWNHSAYCDRCEPAHEARTALQDQGYTGLQAASIVGVLQGGGSQLELSRLLSGWRAGEVEAVVADVRTVWDTAASQVPEPRVQS
jgi:hypothetical protein